MPRPLRFFEPEGVYFITGRCLQARLLMTPSDATNATIGGVLAEALRRWDIELFAFVFMSNHFHLLVRSHSGGIPPFMQYLRSNIAKKLGHQVGWRGKFWDRRYDAEPVLDDEAVVGRLRYILAHGVKEHLVRRCKDWPGLSSLPELTGAAPRSYPWPERAASRQVATSHPLRLAPLPSWSSDAPEVRCRRIGAMVTEIEASAGSSGKQPLMGARRILRQHPHDRPKTIKRACRPSCHASMSLARRRYEARYREFASAYVEASAAFRSGQLDVEFPLYAYRPPWVRVSRRAAA